MDNPKGDKRLGQAMSAQAVLDFAKAVVILSTSSSSEKARKAAAKMKLEVREFFASFDGAQYLELAEIDQDWFMEHLAKLEQNVTEARRVSRLRYTETEEEEEGCQFSKLESDC